ncbi:tRNA (guanosine(37)-N1)-methyltransferase TrmD [Patescibacteria group bacterium]
MKIDIISLFPKMFLGPFNESIIKRAIDKKIVNINIHNLRKWTNDNHRTVDDRPYGGGTGMVLMVEPIYKAIRALKLKSQEKAPKVILLTPQGKVFNQNMAFKMAKSKHIILICGHYEGIDERVRKYLVDEEISIGDYILTGGEIPAIVLTDTIVRLIPGVLEKKQAIKNESFSKFKHIKNKAKKLLEYPQYTRPDSFKGWKVPEILLSGNHKKIDEWREKKAFEKTKKLRPDLI